ncbi:hypothetical protein DB41_EY00110 [Neochlamydia sp. TUME1]|nr:hypothetical protein DB41_EY00110 [Neochlamydia sp. TUME1]
MFFFESEQLGWVTFQDQYFALSICDTGESTCRTSPQASLRTEQKSLDSHCSQLSKRSPHFYFFRCFRNNKRFCFT